MRTCNALLVLALVEFIALGCSRDDGVRVVSSDTAVSESDEGTTTIGLTDAGEPDADSTGDQTSGGEDTTGDDGTGGDTTDGGTGQTSAGTDGGTGQTAAGTGSDGTTGAPEDPSGIYQGSHETAVTTTDGDEVFNGKIAVKVRIDGVFSGTGTGSSDAGSAMQLSITGQVTSGAITATVTWTWPSNGGQTPPPVEMDGTGTLNGTSIAVSFLGGSPAQKFQGTLEMEKTPDE